MRAPWSLAATLCLSAGLAAAAPGVGTDEAAIATCLGCHPGVAATWTNLSSHNLVLGCPTCHAEVTATPGLGHRAVPACATCHSEVAHPAGAACTTCHDPHGSPNIYLVRPQIAVPAGAVPVHLTRPEGASGEGLARAGADGAIAGTGLCEVCHTATKHYDRAGSAAAHSSSWCVSCHGHAAGFAAPK